MEDKLNHVSTSTSTDIYISVLQKYEDWIHLQSLLSTDWMTYICLRKKQSGLQFHSLKQLSHKPLDSVSNSSNSSERTIAYLDKLW